MSQVKLVCPFSKELCRECAIFRGRHMNLCSEDNGNGEEWGAARRRGNKAKERVDDYEAWKGLRVPGVPRSPKMLADIEDLIERREA